MLHFKRIYWAFNSNSYFNKVLPFCWHSLYSPRFVLNWVLASLFVLGTCQENNTPHVGEYKVFENTSLPKSRYQPGVPPVGKKKKVKSAYEPGGPSGRRLTLTGFCSMKRLGILLFPPGWDASPSQGYPPALYRRYPFIHLGEERQRKVKFLA